MTMVMSMRPGNCRADPRGSAQYCTKLFMGPWVGEFGHEIMAVGPMRFSSRSYRHVVACSRPGSAALYADFANEFVGHTIECEGMCAGTTTETRPARDTLMRWVPADMERHMPREYRSSMDAEWYRYGRRRSEYEGAVVIHARARQGHHPERNWPAPLWNRLARLLFHRDLVDRIICIGLKRNSLAIEGALDMRDAPLAEQMDILASARFTMGPSSGPMHLAQHCGCPVLVWCGGGQQERHETQSRYQRHWNPHEAPVHAHRYASWQPSFETVQQWVEEFIAWLEK